MDLMALCCRPPAAFTKTVRIMKLTTLIILTACLSVHATGNAQISLRLKEAPVQQVLTAIEQQSGYKFFFNERLIREAKKISVELSNVSLEQALSVCFKEQPFTYEVIDKSIILKKKNVELMPVDTETKIPDGIDITGRITDLDGKPLEGANVTVKNSNHTTITNRNGYFTLSGISPKDEIEVSYAEFVTQSFKVGSKISFLISLEHSENPLDQVQVIAYGKTSTRLSTGSSTTITSKQIEQQPVSNPLLALQGRVPGLIVNQSTGFSGTGVNLQIRGQNYASGATFYNDPLYVVDGVPYTAQLLGSLSTVLGSSMGNSGGISGSGSPFSYINPDDIESISVLKDADATAIYGTRAANGAILIVTKKGKQGETSVTLNLQNGFGKVGHFLHLMNASQFLDMRHEAFRNDNRMVGVFDFDLNGDWDTTHLHNWQKELIGGTSQYKDYQASFSGGSGNTQYLVSSTYHKETTVFPSDFADQKASVHFNINSVSTNQKFRLQLTGSYLFDKNELPISDLTSSAITLRPFGPDLFNTDGTINWANNSSGTSTFSNNPIANFLTPYVIKTNNLISNASLSYEIIPGLTLSSNLGYTNLVSDETIINPLTSVPDDAKPFTIRSSSFLNQNIHSWIVEPQLNYHCLIGKGRLDVLLGSQANQSFTSGSRINAQGQSSDEVLLNLTAGTSFNVSSLPIAVYKYASLYSRISYNLNNRYVINLSGRRDGSSRFGPENRYANFGSVGAAWIFSDTKFIKGRLPWLSFGKLRSSYGTTGSDQIGDYQYMNLYFLFSTAQNYQDITALLPAGLTNPHLQWALTKKFDLALTLGFLKDRLTLEGNFFQNRSSNQLGNYLLPIITGFQQITKNLPILTQQMGWEFSLSTVNLKTKKFQWNTSFNISLVRGKLLSATGVPFLERYIGHSFVNYFFAYHYLGVDPASGIYQFSDGNGGATIKPQLNTTKSRLTPIDMNPPFYGGMSNSISYKNITLDIMTQFSKKMTINLFMGNSRPGKLINQPVWITDRWQLPGDISLVQRMNTATNSDILQAYQNAMFSDAAYSNVFSLKIKNVSLSWQLPKAFLAKSHLQNAKVYMNAQNVLSFTNNYQGIDPETGVTGLPPLRIISFGIQVSL